MQLNFIHFCIVTCSSGIVVLSKMLYDSFKETSEKQFKFDTITQYKLKDKAFEKKTYQMPNQTGQRNKNGI